MTREEQKIFIAEQIEIFGQDCTMGEFLRDMQKALEQEPNEDVISRRSMHIELEKWIIYGEYKYSNATKYLYDRIDRLPSVKTQEPKWIPISERLPEEHGRYLVTVKDGWVTRALWVGNAENWKEVTAWVPLPEPYKEESEDKT